MSNKTPKTTYLKDYTPPAYRIPALDLRFELDEDFTLVHARLRVIRAEAAPGGTPLVLDGRQLELLSLALDGMPLLAGDYRVEEDRLTLFDPPESFELAAVTRIRPQDNASLEGLYRSSGNFCTQCEAEGFRKITYFLDRPDVMAVFTTTLVADQAAIPCCCPTAIASPAASWTAAVTGPPGTIRFPSPATCSRWWRAISARSRTPLSPVPGARSICGFTSSRKISTNAVTPWIR
jgi:aminopeptidase N